MMMGRRTNWRNVWAIQATMMMLSPVLKADGALTSARIVKRYAAHMVPTMTVIFSPALALKRPMGPGPWTWATAAAILGGPAALRRSMCGWGTYSKRLDIGQASHGLSCARAVGQLRAPVVDSVARAPPSWA